MNFLHQSPRLNWEIYAVCCVPWVLSTGWGFLGFNQWLSYGTRQGSLLCMRWQHHMEKLIFLFCICLIFPKITWETRDLFWRYKSEILLCKLSQVWYIWVTDSRREENYKFKRWYESCRDTTWSLNYVSILMQYWLLWAMSARIQQMLLLLSVGCLQLLVCAAWPCWRACGLTAEVDFVALTARLQWFLWTLSLNLRASECSSEMHSLSVRDGLFPLAHLSPPIVLRLLVHADCRGVTGPRRPRCFLCFLTFFWDYPATSAV